jgi:hypothetical protein
LAMPAPPPLSILGWTVGGRHPGATAGSVRRRPHRRRLRS